MKIQTLIESLNRVKEKTGDCDAQISISDETKGLSVFFDRNAGIAEVGDTDEKALIITISETETIRIEE